MYLIKDSEFGPIPVNPAQAEPVNRAVTGVVPDKLDIPLDDVNANAHAIDQLITSFYHLVNGYDCSGISGTLTSTIIKIKFGGQAKSSEYLAGATIAIATILTLRMLGAIVMVLDKSIEEYERYADESARKDKVLEHIRIKRAYLEITLAMLRQQLVAQAEDTQPPAVATTEIERGLRVLGKQLLSLNALLQIPPKAVAAAELNPGKEEGRELDDLHGGQPHPENKEDNELARLLPPPNAYRASVVPQVKAAEKGGVFRGDDEEEPENPADSEPFSWATLNRTSASIALDIYRRRYADLTPLDKHMLYSLLRQATHGDKEVMDLVQQFLTEAHPGIRTEHVKALNKAIERSMNKKLTPPRLSFGVRFVKAVGDFIFSAGTGITVVTGISGMLALIPGMPVVMLAVYLSAIVVALGFAVAKVAHDMYKEKKHEMIDDKINNEIGRFDQAQPLVSLLGHANKISYKPAALPFAPLPFGGDDAEIQVEADALGMVEQPVYHDVLSPAVMPTADPVARNLFSVFYTTGIAVLTGWSAVFAFSGLVAGISAEIGTGIVGLVGTAAVAVPIAGAVLATGFFVFKTALSLYRDYKAEQMKVDEVNRHLASQQERAKADETHTLLKITSLLRNALLQKYISDYLATDALHNIDVANNQVLDDAQKKEADIKKGLNAEARTRFFSLIEKVVGESKEEAVNDNAYYGYLAGIMLEGNQTPDAVNQAKLLVSKLKAHMDNQDHRVVETDDSIALSSKLEKKPLIFRYLPDGKLDHPGNWRRFRNTFKASSSFVFNAMTPIVIGLAIAMTFASGPAFPIVASLMVLVLGGLFIATTIFQHRRKLRIAAHESTLAQIDMRDKAAKFDHLTQDNAVQPAAVQATELVGDASAQPDLEVVPGVDRVPVPLDGLEQQVPGVDPIPQPLMVVPEVALDDVLVAPQPVVDPAAVVLPVMLPQVQQEVHQAVADPVVPSVAEAAANRGFFGRDGTRIILRPSISSFVDLDPVGFFLGTPEKK